MLKWKEEAKMEAKMEEVEVNEGLLAAAGIPGEGWCSLMLLHL